MDRWTKVGLLVSRWTEFRTKVTEDIGKRVVEMYSVIQQIFIECLKDTKHYSKQVPGWLS